MIDCDADLHAVSAKGETPDQILMRNKVDPEVIERLHQAQRGETRPDLSTLASYKPDPLMGLFADPDVSSLITGPALLGLVLGIARRARAGNMAYPS